MTDSASLAGDVRVQIGVLVIACTFVFCIGLLVGKCALGGRTRHMCLLINIGIFVSCTIAGREAVSQISVRDAATFTTDVEGSIGDGLMDDELYLTGNKSEFVNGCSVVQLVRL